MNTISSFIIDKAGGVFFVKTAKGFEVFRIIIRYAKRLKDQLGVAVTQLFFGKFDCFRLNQHCDHSSLLFRRTFLAWFLISGRPRTGRTDRADFITEKIILFELVQILKILIATTLDFVLKHFILAGGLNSGDEPLLNGITLFFVKRSRNMLLRTEHIEVNPIGVFSEQVFDIDPVKEKLPAVFFLFFFRHKLFL